MTKRQIEKKLVAAGFNMNTVIEIKRDQVEVAVILEGHKSPDWDFTEACADLAAEILGFGDWYRTGYGSIVVDNNYVGAPDEYCTQI